MIAQVSGTVIVKTNEAVVIDVGGVGIEVFASRIALEECQVDAQARLLTRLIVREDSLTLFGFSSAPERDLFDMLIKVSG
ncbi:MAG: OB-fold domain-containing protein, partial [Chloroflexota bacterium]